MVHLFSQKEYPQVKNVVPSPTDFPTQVAVKDNHCINFESQVMVRNEERRNKPDVISSPSQHEPRKSENLTNTPISSISSPSQG